MITKTKTWKGTTTDAVDTEIFLNGVTGQAYWIAIKGPGSRIVNTNDAPSDIASEDPRDLVYGFIVIAAKQRGEMVAQQRFLSFGYVADPSGNIGTLNQGIKNNLAALYGSAGTWKFQVDIVDGRKMKLTVTGEAGKTIDWKATFVPILD